jgi:pyrroline-5-carboxylate reductase
MGTALIRGLLKKKLVDPDQLFAYDILDDISMELSKDTGINVALSNLQIVEQCTIIIVCVKPQVFETTLRKLQTKKSQFLG